MTSPESMNRSGMHASTVCCASVHIKKIDCTYISMPKKVLAVKHLRYMNCNLGVTSARFHTLACSSSDLIQTLKL